jgi:hypothetical protein
MGRYADRLSGVAFVVRGTLEPVTTDDENGISPEKQ